jgi:hypothetical protein
VVHNVSTGAAMEAGKLPKIMAEILEAGGLVSYFKQHGDFKG